MKINVGSRILCARFFLILGLGLPTLSVNVAHAEPEREAVSLSTRAPETVSTTALRENQPAELNQVYAMAAAESASAGDDFEWDPWEPFNERMFWFNREVLDRFVLKPVATAWDFVLPNQVQRGVHNVFDNLAVVRRVVNNTLQLKFAGAAKEAARFTINSTIGVVGFFDVAKEGFGIEQSDQDMGLTFGVWGVGPGPFLVLPFLPPLTVRDGIGFLVDTAMTPYIYFIPWYASLGGTVTNTVNERSLNLDRYERVEEATVDLYAAVRSAYLQRRAAAIRQ
ncbi:MAG TPA: VacJ family lipoprotein [Candidatus Binatia bacterium]|nr:VacJ family lipoprotein [Candidatus Binatia bacterium]